MDKVRFMRPAVPVTDPVPVTAQVVVTEEVVRAPVRVPGQG